MCQQCAKLCASLVCTTVSSDMQGTLSLLVEVQKVCLAEERQNGASETLTAVIMKPTSATVPSGTLGVCGSLVCPEKSTFSISLYILFYESLFRHFGASFVAVTWS